MLKKSAIILMLAILTVLTVFGSAPLEALGYKACMAAHVVKQKAFTATHPLPDDGFAGNASASVDGSGAERVPVLMFHYVVPAEYNLEPGNRSILNLETFEAVMEHLHEKGYYAASLRELEDYVRGYAKLPERTVVLTFDDGYENNVVYAYPVMRKYGFKAALFVVGKNVGEVNGDFDPMKRSYVSKQQMAESADVFEFHSHTYDLHHKTQQHCGKMISAAADADKLDGDIDRMKALGIDTPYFAYPYGETNYRVVHRLTTEGYRMAFTVKDGYVRAGDNPMYLRRITVTNETDYRKLFD